MRSGAPLVQAPLQTGRRAPHPRPGRPGAGGPGGVALGGDPRQPDGPDGRSKGGCKGYDAGKRLHGRKRHILTDTDGRLLAVELHGADVQDRDGAKGVLKRSRRRFPFVERVFAGKLVSWASDKTHVVLEIVRRRPWVKGVVVLRRRWVGERTFAWIMKCRRLVRDYEQLTRVAETLLRRWQ